MKLLETGHLSLKIKKKRMHPDNLISKDKTGKRNPKHFRNYQNPTDLFKSLIDGTIMYTQKKY